MQAQEQEYERDKEQERRNKFEQRRQWFCNCVAQYKLRYRFRKEFSVGFCICFSEIGFETQKLRGCKSRSMVLSSTCFYLAKPEQPRINEKQQQERRTKTRTFEWQQEQAKQEEQEHEHEQHKQEQKQESEEGKELQPEQDHE